MRREHLPDALLAVLVLAVVSFSVSVTRADPDLWGHVRFGQDILASRSISRLDPYSFTSDRPWINHEWLSEVLMASAYQLGGSSGLIALKWLLTVGALVTLWRAIRHAGVFRPVAVGLLLVTVFGAYGLTVTLRPQLFSMLLYTILLALLNGIGRGSTRLFLWMPVLFALWANLHGGWIVGIGVLGLWSTCALLSRRISWRWAAGGTLLGLIGTLATPYGPELWQFLWETVGLGRVDIAEWQPLTREPYALILWAIAASPLVVAWRRLGWAASPLLAPSVVLGALALRVARLEGFFALTTVIMLAPCFAALGPRRLPLSRKPTRSDSLLVGAVCLVGLLSAGVAISRHAKCVTLAGADESDPWAPEAEGITFFQINQLRGRLLTYFDYGELAIWHLAPRLRVSYDGRRETVYSAEVQTNHLRFYFGVRDTSYARILKADYVWLPRRLPVNAALDRDGWVRIFEGPRSVIYARQMDSYKQPAPWTGPRCFPGP
jgi:hypothetical protein